ncbi:uncharacterized protein L201_000925 [Kwoniella dendrophila CBS 6074]|uniref:Uncharacterized protein n=1 Tax=Kwoniella dendrophila CBS 6074 TaxID=1295534 RepID=A0AAX4JKY0_9TREE
MGCTSSKSCHDPDCPLPRHGLHAKTHPQRSLSLSKPRHITYSAKARRSSESSSSSKVPMIQRDSVAKMRDMIAFMGGWHEDETRR